MPTSSDNAAWPGRRVRYAAFAAKLAKQRGNVDLADDGALINSGSNRTRSKSAILDALTAARDERPLPLI